MHLSSSPYVFKYNRTFGDAPSPATDDAWKALFPEQGGYFRHPDLAPERSALSVFHQLHCLNGIRSAYWTLLKAATTDSSDHRFDVDSLPMEFSPPHIRHCIDLIRQSLMCHPDIAIEAKNDTLGGVTGFGTVHECKDWDELMRWTRKWQAYGQERRANGKTATHGHHHPKNEDEDATKNKIV